MGAILALTIYLWIGFAYAQSEEDIQQPVLPVPAETENAAQLKSNQDAPKSDALPSPSPVAVNIYAAEQQEAKTENKQGHTNVESTKWTDPIAIFTGLLVLVTLGLIYVGYRQGQSTRTIERAYVKMSHSPPGLAIEKSSGRCCVTMQAKNFGRTPARVTDALLKSQVVPSNESLPDIPDYGGTREKGNTLKAFLVTEDECFAPWEFSIGVENISGIEAGTKKLWLYGYVDYIDQFGQRHRAGYARVYDPKVVTEGGQTNLVFVVQEGYNYDRPRKKGEGNDWKEKPASN